MLLTKNIFNLTIIGQNPKQAKEFGTWLKIDVRLQNP